MVVQQGYTDQRFGSWQVLEYSEDEYGAPLWRCRCDCGREFTVSRSKLIGHYGKGCNCDNKRGRLIEIDGERKTLTQWCKVKDISINVVHSRIKRGMTVEDALTTPVKKVTRSDLTGQRFGSLTVLGFAYTKDHKNIWACRCDCGNERFVYTGELVGGRIKTCAECVKKKRRVLTDNEGKVYTAEEVMALTGISLERVYSRLRDGWSEDEVIHTPRKISGFGSGQIIEYNGESHNIPEWGRIIGISSTAIRYRLKTKLPLDEVLNPRARPNGKEKFITYNGETHSIIGWSKITNIHPATIKYRVNSGWPVEQALTVRPGERRK